MDSASALLNRYATALKVLKTSEQPQPEVVLNLLLCRDQLQTEIGVGQLPSVELLRVVELDEQLKQQRDRVARALPLADWRASLNIADSAWWWHLEASAHRLDRFDWVWNALTVTSLTASASLVVEISSKFLVVSPGLFGSFAVVGQSVLTLATAGSVLTDAGRRGIEQALTSFGVRKYFWQETKLGLSLLLLLGLVGLRASLPQISEMLTASGSSSVETGELAEAELELKRAIGLDSDNAEAHYQLGQVYDQIQHPDQALAQYQIATQNGHPSAATALTGLYLEQGNDAQAAALASQTLAALPETPETLPLRYRLYLHLGEAQLAQDRFNQALESFQIAARLAQQLAQSDRSARSGQTSENAISAPAAAPFCLLAETLEQQQRNQAALSFWQRCLNYASEQDAEENRWIGTAAERLRNQ